jgi:hypothetical protein
MTDKFKAYISDIATLETILNNLSKQQLDYRISDDKWNIREIMAHLVDTEIQVYTRYRSILADDVPFLVNHNENKWAVAFNHSTIDVKESFSTFKLIRNLNYRLIESLNEDKLKMQGLHSTRGKMTIQNLVEAHIVHLKKHIEQIDRNIKAFSKATA